MAKHGLIAVLDIGSTKIACFIAEVSAAGKLKILGIGHQISEGIRAGIVIDIKQAEAAILAAVHAAEKMAGETIDEVIINISGTSIASHTVHVETAISGQEVTDRDINHIIRQGYSHYNKEEVEIIHCVPTHYTIDDSTGIKDPRGMFGDTLSTNLHVVTISSTAFRNVCNCLARCHLHIKDCVASPFASGLACLSYDEKKLGAAVVDIGGGNTSISVFDSGSLVYVDTVALGGLHVTRDVARGLSTTLSFAERIKTIYGSAITTSSDENEMIDIPALGNEEGEEQTENGETSYISKALLTSIIQPRMEEILEIVNRQLDGSGFGSLVSRVVLTGGGSQIQGLKELAGHIFHKHTRVGKPISVDGLAESTKGPGFSTCVGMLQYGMQEMFAENGSILETEMMSKNYLKRMWGWFQDNL